MSTEEEEAMKLSEISDRLLDVFTSRSIPIISNTPVFTKYIRLCYNYHKTPSDLADEVDARIIDDNNVDINDMAFVNTIEQYYRKQVQKSLNKRRRSSINIKRNFVKKEFTASPNFVQNEKKDFNDEEDGEGNKVKRRLSLRRESIKIVSKEDVIVTYNCARSERFFNNHSQMPRVRILSSVPENSTYMNDTDIDRNEVLVNRVCDLCERILIDNDIDESMLKPINSLPNTEGIFWGRIISETSTGDKKLNRESVMLEAFKNNDINSSRCIKLDLKGVKGVKDLFFPGEVVAVEGTINNYPADVIHVKKVYSEIKQNEIDIGEEMVDSLNIICASGPFTTADNLDFIPLSTLLEVVTKKRPDLLILLGPFVNVNNNLIENDVVEIPYDQIFREKIIDMIKNYDLPNNTKVIIIPSLEDVHHHFVYPQLPFKKIIDENIMKDDEYDEVSDDGKIMFLSNPSIFMANGVTVGVNTNDILNQMRQLQYSTIFDYDELNKKIFRKIIKQNSFYPMFIGSNEVPFDYSLSKYLKFQDYEVPSVLIMSSKNKPFVYKIDNHFIVNPYRLTVNRRAGAYAQIYVPKNCFIKDDIDEEMKKEEEEEEVRNIMDTSNDGEEERKEEKLDGKIDISDPPIEKKEVDENEMDISEDPPIEKKEVDENTMDTSNDFEEETKVDENEMDTSDDAQFEKKEEIKTDIDNDREMNKVKQENIKLIDKKYQMIKVQIVEI